MFCGVGGGAGGGIGTGPIPPIAALVVAWNMVASGITIICVVAAVTGVTGMIAKPGAAGPLTATVVGVVSTVKLCGVRGCIALRKAVC